MQAAFQTADSKGTGRLDYSTFRRLVLQLASGLLNEHEVMTMGRHFGGKKVRTYVCVGGAGVWMCVGVRVCGCVWGEVCVWMCVGGAGVWMCVGEVCVDVFGCCGCMYRCEWVWV